MVVYFELHKQNTTFLEVSWSGIKCTLEVPVKQLQLSGGHLRWSAGVSTCILSKVRETCQPPAQSHMSSTCTMDPGVDMNRLKSGEVNLGAGN